MTKQLQTKTTTLTRKLVEVTPVLNLKRLREIEARQPIDCAAEAVELIGADIICRPYEQSLALFLTFDLRPICFSVTGHGTAHSVSVDLRSIVVTAALQHAAFVVLIHTHPGPYSSPSAPSPKDIETTIDLHKKLQWFGIKVIDAFILCHCAQGPKAVTLVSITDTIAELINEKNETEKNEISEESLPEI